MEVTTDPPVHFLEKSEFIEIHTLRTRLVANPSFVAVRTFGSICQGTHLRLFPSTLNCQHKQKHTIAAGCQTIVMPGVSNDKRGDLGAVNVGK